MDAANAAELLPLPIVTEAETEILPLLLANRITVDEVAAALKETPQFTVAGGVTIAGVQERLLNCAAGACTVTTAATLAPE